MHGPLPVGHDANHIPTHSAACGHPIFLKGPIIGKKLYVGNLSYATRDDDLQQLFSQHGGVVSASVMTDRDSGRSKGFGFVEMSSDAEAQAAIQALNGYSADGRALVGAAPIFFFT